MRLHLRQVEVRAGAAREQLLRVVEEVAARSRRCAPETGLPSTRDVLLVEVPAARARDAAPRSCRSGGSCLPSPARSVIVRRTASRRLICPSIMLSQVGQLASSKSAMKVEAPQLSALITILRSVGPVISTRRSSRSCGCAAIFQSASRICRRLGQEIGQLAGVELPSGARRAPRAAPGGAARTCGAAWRRKPARRA